MMIIKCPKCGTDSKLSLLQSRYEGPHKCWKCRELFTIKIENNEVKSCEPLSQEEFDRQRQESDRQREIEALKSKLKRQ
jgi:hypothetical protein